MHEKSRLIRVLGGLALAGGVAAVPLMVGFDQLGWGSPGTAVYERYELLNRLMSGALLLMAAGWWGMVLGLPPGYGRGAAIVAFSSALLMVVGVAAEFWLYSDLPYAAPNMRQAAFGLFSMSSLVLDLGVTVLGMALWRGRLWPRWSAVLLMLALPLDLVAFFGLDSIFLAATILALVVGVNLLRINPVLVEMETAVP